MRLVEFIQPIEESESVRTLHSEEPDPGIAEYLRKRGFVLIGQGVDQMAFRSRANPDWVLKVFSAGKNGQPNPGHEMFFTWAQLCMSKPDNPFLPRFAGYEKFEWEGELYLQIWQEKLRENWDRVYDVAKMAGIVTMFVDQGLPDEKILENFWEDRRMGRSEDEVPPYNIDLDYLNKDRFELLIRTTMTLYRLCLKNGWHWDLHEENIMFRGGRTPVLVDPWVA